MASVEKKEETDVSVHLKGRGTGGAAVKLGSIIKKTNGFFHLGALSKTLAALASFKNKCSENAGAGTTQTCAAAATAEKFYTRNSSPRIKTENASPSSSASKAFARTELKVTKQQERVGLDASTSIERPKRYADAHVKMRNIARITKRRVLMISEKAAKNVKNIIKSARIAAGRLAKIPKIPEMVIQSKLERKMTRSIVRKRVNERLKTIEIVESSIEKRRRVTKIVSWSREERLKKTETITVIAERRMNMIEIATRTVGGSPKTAEVLATGVENGVKITNVVIENVQGKSVSTRSSPFSSQKSYCTCNTGEVNRTHIADESVTERHKTSEIRREGVDERFAIADIATEIIERIPRLAGIVRESVAGAYSGLPLCRYMLSGAAHMRMKGTAVRVALPFPQLLKLLREGHLIRRRLAFRSSVSSSNSRRASSSGIFHSITDTERDYYETFTWSGSHSSIADCKSGNQWTNFDGRGTLSNVGNTSIFDEELSTQQQIEARFGLTERVAPRRHLPPETQLQKYEEEEDEEEQKHQEPQEQQQQEQQQQQGQQRKQQPQQEEPQEKQQRHVKQQQDEDKKQHHAQEEARVRRNSRKEEKRITRQQGLDLRRIMQQSPLHAAVHRRGRQNVGGLLMLLQMFVCTQCSLPTLFLHWHYALQQWQQLQRQSVQQERQEEEYVTGRHNRRRRIRDGRRKRKAVREYCEEGRKRLTGIKEKRRGHDTRKRTATRDYDDVDRENLIAGNTAVGGDADTPAAAGAAARRASAIHKDETVRHWLKQNQSAPLFEDVKSNSTDDANPQLSSVVSLAEEATPAAAATAAATIKGTVAAGRRGVAVVGDEEEDREIVGAWKAPRRSRCLDVMRAQCFGDEDSTMKQSTEQQLHRLGGALCLLPNNLRKVFQRLVFPLPAAPSTMSLFYNSSAANTFLMIHEGGAAEETTAAPAGREGIGRPDFVLLTAGRDTCIEAAWDTHGAPGEAVKRKTRENLEGHASSLVSATYAGAVLPRMQHIALRQSPLLVKLCDQQLLLTIRALLMSQSGTERSNSSAGETAPTISSRTNTISNRRSSSGSRIRALCTAAHSDMAAGEDEGIIPNKEDRSKEDIRQRQRQQQRQQEEKEIQEYEMDDVAEELGGNSFLVVPQQVPKSLYFPTALHNSAASADRTGDAVPAADPTCEVFYRSYAAPLCLDVKKQEEQQQQQRSAQQQQQRQSLQQKQQHQQQSLRQQQEHRSQSPFQQGLQQQQHLDDNSSSNSSSTVHSCSSKTEGRSTKCKWGISKGKRDDFLGQRVLQPGQENSPLQQQHKESNSKSMLSPQHQEDTTSKGRMRRIAGGVWGALGARRRRQHHPLPLLAGTMSTITPEAKYLIADLPLTW